MEGEVSRVTSRQLSFFRELCALLRLTLNCGLAFALGLYCVLGAAQGKPRQLSTANSHRFDASEKDAEASHWCEMGYNSTFVFRSMSLNH